MVNKMNFFALLMCIVMFGMLSSCAKDDPPMVSVPTGDAETLKLLIGKWDVTMHRDKPGSITWSGLLEFKNTGELIGDGVWNWGDGGTPWQGKGSYSLCMMHLLLSIPDPIVSHDGDWTGYDNLFEYSGTIQSISNESMTIRANWIRQDHYGTCTFVCRKIE